MIGLYECKVVSCASGCSRLESSLSKWSCTSHFWSFKLLTLSVLVYVNQSLKLGRNQNVAIRFSFLLLQVGFFVPIFENVRALRLVTTPFSQPGTWAMRGIVCAIRVWSTLLEETNTLWLVFVA